MPSYHHLIGTTLEMVMRRELKAERSEDVLFMRACFLRTQFFLGAFISLPVTSLRQHAEMHWKYLEVLFGKKRTAELFQKVLADKANEEDDFYGHYRAIERFAKKMKLEEFLRSPNALTDFE